MGGKRVALIVVLVVVIIAGFAFAIATILGRRSAKPPERVTGVKVTRIDENTLELITLTEGEWMKLGQKNQRYKNPKTGSYTMVAPVTCPFCGELIPALIYPRGASAEERRELMENWVCPKCGKNIASAPPPGR